MLRSGALPASMSYLEEQIVGPSLGAVVIAQAIAFVLAYLFGARGGVVTTLVRERRALTA